jgi:hypothetical protein
MKKRIPFLWHYLSKAGDNMNASGGQEATASILEESRPEISELEQ